MHLAKQPQALVDDGAGLVQVAVVAALIKAGHASSGSNVAFAPGIFPMRRTDRSYRGGSDRPPRMSWSPWLFACSNENKQSHCSRAYVINEPLVCRWHIESAAA